MLNRVYKVKAENLTLKQIKYLRTHEFDGISYPKKLQDWNIDDLTVPMTDSIAKQIDYKGEIIIS